MTPTDVSTWPENLRSPVEVFLDHVEQSLLGAGIRRSTRADVVRTLQSKVSERLFAQGGDTMPTPELVSETLNELGMTGANAGPAFTRPEWRAYLRSLKPQRSRCAFWGVVCVTLGLLPLMALLVVLAFFSPSGLQLEAHFPRDRVEAQMGVPEAAGNSTTLFQATGPDGFVRASAAADTPLRRFFWLFAPISPLALAATLLGLLAVVDILRSRGRVTGLAGALFALLFYPLFLTALSFWLAA